MKSTIERKRTPSGIQWYIDGTLAGELNGLTFENLTPTFEKVLKMAATQQHVRLVKEDDTYVCTITGLMKFINVL